MVLGEASYALYILHIPLLFWWPQFLDATRLNLPPVLSFGLFLVGAVFISVLVWRFWEAPMRRFLLRRPRAFTRA